MRSLTAALLYPGVGLLETTNLSVGRGTDRPFEQIGAPDRRSTARRRPERGLAFPRHAWSRCASPCRAAPTRKRSGGVHLYLDDCHSSRCRSA
ncbi:MAG: DUF1343 domain-containing protein [Gemmataceae bacterium]